MRNIYCLLFLSQTNIHHYKKYSEPILKHLNRGLWFILIKFIVLSKGVLHIILIFLSHICITFAHDINNMDQ